MVPGLPEEADAAWNRMQSPETFTKADMHAYGRFIAKYHRWAIGEDYVESNLDAFLEQRRKP